MSLPQEIRQLWESFEGRGVLGQKVDRAAGIVPVTAIRLNLYTITVGEILLTCLYGVCTIAETGGANAVVFDATPTVGGALSPMDNGAGDINGSVVGDMMGPQGNIALPAVGAGTTGAIPTMWMPWICKVGNIGITMAAATADSSWRWVLYYIPLTEGALVVATP